MKQLTSSVVFAAFTLSVLALEASAEPRYAVEQSATFIVDQRKATYNVSPPGKRDNCASAIAEIKASGAKVIHSSWSASPYLKFGGVKAGDGVDITFENAEKLCAEYERYWIRSTNGKELLGIAAFLESEIKDSVEAAKYAVEEGDRCAKLVDEILAAGFPGTIRMVVSAGSKELTKTLDEVKPKVCDVQRAKGEATLKQAEESEGVLRKALKADKLDIAQSRNETQFYGVGRKALNTPAQLAASKLWFSYSWSDRICRSNGGQVHTVHRYQFNAKHVLVTETSKEFCGAPPTSAYR